MKHHTPLVALAAAAGLSACETAPTPNSNADLVVIADDIDYDADNYTVTAGKIDIELFQQGAIRHTLLIEDANGTDRGIRLDVEARGSNDTDTITLEAGTYTLYCDIPGHQSAGMTATLTVTEPTPEP